MTKALISVTGLDTTGIIASVATGTLTVETLRFALQALLGFIFLSSFWYFYVVWCCIFIQYVV